MKKITKATFKSFIAKNRDELSIRVLSKFDSCQDGVRSIEDQFDPVVEADYAHENNLGIQGVWLVLGGRDWFTAYDKDGFVGIEVDNCCGNFVVAIKGE